MDILSISQDDNESDTSQEDIDEDWDDTCEISKLKESNTGQKQQPDFDQWKREPEIHSDSNKNVQFMLLDCDFGIISTNKISLELIPFLSPPLRDLGGQQSYIRLHGLTQAGNSVCCNVFNFLPYFYALPLPGSEFSESDLPEFQKRLSNAVVLNIKEQMKWVPFHDMVDRDPPVVSIEILNLNEAEVKIFDFFQDLREVKNWESTVVSADSNSVMLKIICRVPKFAWIASKILRNGLIKYPVNKDTGKHCTYEVYEGNINHTIRFLTDLNFPGCSWLGIREGQYFRRDPEAQLSHAQIEIDICHTAIELIPEMLYIPPLRILSFDIEVMTRPPNFPFPVHGAEPVIQIGNVLATWPSNSDPLKFVFTLKSCEAIPGTEVFSFENEKDLLNAWREFVIKTDPDILTGYNIKRFDLPYLLDRAHRIDITAKLPYLGRLKNSQSCIREVQNYSKRCSRYDNKTVTVSGRVIVDMMIVMMRHNTKPKYSQTKNGEFTLAEVSNRYLGEAKADVKYTDIFTLQEESDASRKVLATYCVQDAKLPYSLLMQHIPEPKKFPEANVLEYYIDLARASGLPLKYLVNKSKDYHSYFRRVRKAKHPEVKFESPTPSPVKAVAAVASSSTISESVLKKSFADLGNGSDDLKCKKKIKFW